MVDFDDQGRGRAIIEKPEVAPSNYAVTGLYCLDGTAPDKARQITPSAHGELEIVSLLEMYLAEGTLSVETMGRGYAWLDTGTHESLLDACNFVRTLEMRQGLQIGSPDEIAHAQGWIDDAALAARADMCLSALRLTSWKSDLRWVWMRIRMSCNGLVLSFSSANGGPDAVRALRRSSSLTA